MNDLAESPRLFEASSRLDSAASVLGKLSSGQTPTTTERDALIWAGRFLSQVDWTAGDFGAGGASGNLAIQATVVRPTFYAALISIERRLHDAGLNQGKELVDFLRSLYQLLIRGGPRGRAKSALSSEKLRLASIFLRELSQGLLIQITDNGVPRKNELLV